MGRKLEKVIIRHETLEDLNTKIKIEEKSVRVLERLYFIRFLYKGDSVKEACERVNITEPTGYRVAGFMEQTRILRSDT